MLNWERVWQGRYSVPTILGRTGCVLRIGAAGGNIRNWKLGGHMLSILNLEGSVGD